MTNEPPNDQPKNEPQTVRVAPPAPEPQVRAKAARVANPDARRKKLTGGLLIGLSLLLVAGLAVQFTPQLGSGGLFGGQKGTPALKVNGAVVTAEDLEAQRRGNPVLANATDGLLGDDFKIYLVRQAINREATIQALKGIQVSRADIDAEVTKVREANNLTDNKAWTDALQGAGLSDSQFRQQTRDQLAYQRKIEELKKATPAATDAEIQTYYDLNKEQFRSEARIVGRSIVVADEAKARALLVQARGGADFAALASQNSLENKERGGALGPIENGAPRAVTAAVLPTEVSTAAFALPGGGLTDVVASGGRYYIVKVDRLLPAAVRPLAEARKDVATAVDNLKQNAAAESWVREQQKDPKVEYVLPEWKVEDPVVATVAGQNIPYSDIVGGIVNNQQIAGLLGQLPPDQVVGLLNSSFKPQLVQQAIDTYAAPNIASKLGLALVGSRAEVAQQLAAYGGRNASVSSTDVQKYYRENITQFESPASATLDEASFRTRAQADAFRTDWNGQGSFLTAATRAGGTVSERGQITTDSQSAAAELVTAALGGDLRAVQGGGLTPVVKVGDRFSVGHVTNLVKATTQPLTAVSPQIRDTLLAQKRGEAGQAFLNKEVAALKPVSKLDAVLAAQAKRVEAQKPATPPAGTTPNESTDPAATPGTGETGSGGASGSNGATGGSTPGGASETPATGSGDADNGGTQDGSAGGAAGSTGTPAETTPPAQNDR